jgi:hypothetical protein
MVSNPTADQIEVVMEAFAPGTLPALEERCELTHKVKVVPHKVKVRTS